MSIFVKGFGKGILGGTLVSSSKHLVYNFAQSGRYELLWASKLLNATGNSVVENGASNLGAFDKWSMTYGFNHIEVNLKNNGSRTDLVKSSLT